MGFVGFAEFAGVVWGPHLVLSIWYSVFSIQYSVFNLVGIILDFGAEVKDNLFVVIVGS